MSNIRQKINQLRVAYFQPAPHMYGRSFSSYQMNDYVCSTNGSESLYYGTSRYRSPCVLVTARVSPIRFGPLDRIYIPNAGVTQNTVGFEYACYPKRIKVNPFTSIDHYDNYFRHGYLNAFNLHRVAGWTPSPIAIDGMLPLSF